MKNTIKKTLLLVAIIATSIICLAFSASASDSLKQCGPNLSYILDKNTGVITISGEGDMYDFDYGEPFFGDNGSYIKSVVIKEGVTSIGDNAFAECENLTEINIADSVTSIGDFAFYDCSSLKEISLPDTVTSIGESVFEYCTSIKTIDVGDGVTTINDNAFYYCSNLESIILGSSVSAFAGDGFFYECEKLSSITVSENNQKFSSSENGILFNKNKTTLLLFPRNKNLDTYTVPGTVTVIANEAFENCTKLERVTLPDGVTYIGYHAFYNCTDLKDINIPDSVTTIGDGVFYKCKIKNITIPDGITSVSKSLFSYCELLESVTLPESITTIDNGAFYRCYALKKINIPKNLTTVSDHAFNFCGVEKITLPDSVTYIGYGAFSGSSIKSINIPQGITEILASTFEGTDITDIQISDGVTIIGDEAFAYCGNIEKITIPDSVTSIGIEAFRYCQNLKTITLGNGITTIGTGAFEYCENLKYLNIPDGVTFIDRYTIRYCPNLEYLTIPASVTELFNYNVFEGCGIKDIYFTGTEAQWKTLTEYIRDYCIENATIHYNSSAPVEPETPTEPEKPATPTKLDKPSSITATQSATAIKISWSKVNGATGYRIYRRSGNEWLVSVPTTTGTSYTFKNLKAGTKYTFAVKPYIKSNEKIAWGDYVTVNTATKAVKPSKVTATQTTSSIKLTWNKCSGATGYRIYYKSGSSWKIAVKATTSTSHTFKNLKAGAKFTFAIRPYIKNGSSLIWSDYSTIKAATKPATPTVKVASPSKGKMTVTWNAVKGAETYQVYYKIGNGNFKLYKTYSKAGTLTFKNLKSTTKYTFAVRAVIKTDSGNMVSGYKTSAVKIK